jgi:hypothetical protein
MSPTEKPAITQAEFHASSEHLALTAQQKVWVDYFVETADAKAATRKAYETPSGPKGAGYIAMFTEKLETSPRILAALDLFYGRSPRERFLRDLQLDIRHAKGVAKIEARHLYAKVAFGVDGALPAEPETEARFKVGDIVLVDGVKHRVTAVDASGKPTDGDPL